eukprot:427360-Prymnesium_polylepis.1
MLRESAYSPRITASACHARAVGLFRWQTARCVASLTKLIRTRIPQQPQPRSRASLNQGGCSRVRQ